MNKAGAYFVAIILAFFLIGGAAGYTLAGYKFLREYEQLEGLISKYKIKQEQRLSALEKKYSKCK